MAGAAVAGAPPRAPSWNGSAYTATGARIQKRDVAFDVAGWARPGIPDGRSGVVASYNFESIGAGGRFYDGSGNGNLLNVFTRAGGTLRTVAHGTGHAVVFPAVCRDFDCPRVALEAASRPRLSPGTRPIRFGATVLLSPTQTTGGQNILQKGRFAAGGQYKLQVDSRPGKPSCAMASEGTGIIHLARSGVTIADGHWHTVECRRDGARLSILVDGFTRGATTIPAGLTVHNAEPLTLGAKGVGWNNDQFHGALDDAWISIG
ncbi:LamG-like jellyroll fold domain-containing protein [Actinoplanes sp. NPDC026623]|uniref:LamG-like jellyroll fold domain-containing protein n=1 Tax=Actinoplanes sp. NPDC026623 TaxID=3155610 RepID=UPI0033FDE6FA